MLALGAACPNTQAAMLGIDLTGRRAFVAGITDANGFGYAIALALAQAGATVCFGVWPPALGVYEKLSSLGKLDKARRMSDGSLFAPEGVYALDAAYDTLDQVPTAVRDERRYAERGDFTIDGVRAKLQEQFGDKCLDIVVHALANSPEIGNELIDTSRAGYLAALSVSSYSLVSMVKRWGPLFRQDGSVLSLSYIAGQRVVHGYGGGMSAAKAALESDTKVLAYEAGRRWGIRVNSISAGPVATRAASSTGIIGQLIGEYERVTPSHGRLTTDEVGKCAAFLLSPLARAITGVTLYVDYGFHMIGWTGEPPPSSSTNASAR